MIRRTMWLSLELRHLCLMSREALLGIRTRTGPGGGGFVVIIYNLGLCVIFLF